MIGTWVVVRGMSFMGDALAHGVLPGIALAFVWGIDVTVGALVSAAVMVAGIDVVHRRARLPEDTGIGLLFVGMLALGVIVISREGSYAGDLTSFLFGDILGIRTPDLWLQAAVAVGTSAAVILLYRPFLALSFNRDKAAALGLRPALAHVAMLVLLALAVVSSFRIVGTLLVFGLLIAPPATATLLVRRLPAVMAARHRPRLPRRGHSAWPSATTPTRPHRPPSPASPSPSSSSPSRRGSSSPPSGIARRPPERLPPVQRQPSSC